MEAQLITHAVDYQVILNIGISLFGILLSALLGIGFKLLSELRVELREMMERHHKLSVNLPTQYVAKNDFQYMIDALFAKLDKIEDKIDKKVDKNAPQGG